MIEQGTMARAAIKKTIKPAARSTTTASSRPKVGRPPGSKNRSTAAPLKAATPPTRSVVSRKAAPVAPKMNKAELELQLAKLERLVTRLREQNKELKALAKPAEAPKEAKPAAKPARATLKPIPATKTRKPRVSKAAKPSEVVEADNASE